MVDWQVVNLTVNGLGGVAVLALGLLLLTLGQGNRPALLFGLFSTLWGLSNTVENGAILARTASPALADNSLLEALSLASWFLWIGAAGLLVWFAVIHPVPHLTRPWGYWLGGGFAAAAFAIPFIDGFLSDPPLYAWLTQTGVWWLAGAATFGAWLHIARFENAGVEDRHELLIMAFAFAVYVLFRAGEAVGEMAVTHPGAPFEDAFAFGTYLVALAALVGLTLGWATVWRSCGPGGRGARTMMAMTLGIALLGQLTLMLEVVHGVPYWGQYGVLRFVMVGTVAYGILRHQFLGIEVRLRWGISRSTLLALFVAVFIVTTTVASEFLLDTYGYVVGGVAVGVLLMAAAPIKRWTDSLARHAVPVTSARAEAIFRSAIEAATRDGTLTRREERHLMDVAEGLAIGAARAMAMVDAMSPRDAA